MIAPVSQHQRSTPNFKGYDPNKFYNRVTDGLTDKIANTVAKLHGKKNPGALIDWINSHKKLKENIHPIMLNLASFAYTATLMTNTANSKSIEKDRKPMLILNAALVTAVSSVASFIVDKKTDGLIKKIKNEYVSINGNLSRTKISQIESSLKKVKSITLFTFIVRLIVPLIMVPITGSIVKRAKAKKNAQMAAAEIERFRRANPELMGEYDKLKALSAKIAQKQISDKGTKKAGKASKNKAV